MKNTIFLTIAAFFATASLNAQSTVDSIAAKYKLLPMPSPLTTEKIFPVLGTYQLTTADATGTTAGINTTTTETAATTDASTTTDAIAAGTATGTDATTTTASDITASAPSLTVTLDSASKGIVWVDGLPQGRIKAYLRQSPSTYRITEQKTESGEQISEGTLVYDTAAKVLNIALGVPYNDANPTAVFLTGTTAPEETEAEVATTTKSKKAKAKAKAKPKVTFYTATKVEQTPAVTEESPIQPEEQNQDAQTQDAQEPQQDQQQPQQEQPQPTQEGQENTDQQDSSNPAPNPNPQP